MQDSKNVPPFNGLNKKHRLKFQLNSFTALNLCFQQSIFFHSNAFAYATLMFGINKSQITIVRMTKQSQNDKLNGKPLTKPSLHTMYIWSLNCDDVSQYLHTPHTYANRIALYCFRIIWSHHIWVGVWLFGR